MKCIKNKESQEIVRVNNILADQLVKKGTHGYASKEAWKKQGRKYYGEKNNKK